MKESRVESNDKPSLLFPIFLYYPDQSGGPSNTIYWHNKALIRNNIKSITVTTSIGIPDNLHNRWITTEHGLVKYTTNHFAKFPLKLIVNCLTQMNKINIIHFSSVFYPPSLLIFLLNFFFYRKKVVWSVRGEFSNNALGFKNIFKKIYLIPIKLFKNSVIWHATSDLEAEDIKSILGGGINIVNISNFIELPERLNKQSLNKSFLYVGRIHQIKALDNLIKAVALSKKFTTDPYTHLDIVGDDSNETADTLKKLVKYYSLEDKISFRGHLTGKLKNQIFTNAYFFVLPSHSENFGNVVIESLAQGTPVIASKGTPWESLEKNNAGFWTENTPEMLAKTIDQALSLDITSYEQMSKNAYSFCVDQFDVYKNINQWIEAYNHILK